MTKFYISTAIAYAYSKPHIGNTYELILADAIARYQRLIGNEVYFQTGTDEHGEKVENAAIKLGIAPQKFVDDLSSLIKDVTDSVNISYDKFVRTSDPYHKERVSKIFDKLYKNGDIYKGEYNGWYCTPCESFFTESQLIDGKCPDCSRDVYMQKEEAYFLNMKKYEQRLYDYIESNPNFLLPVTRKNEIVNSYLKPGLQDLCISRSTVKWGIPVSFDPEHVVYVWLDALSNYITFLGYNVDSENDKLFNDFWPADIQLIGKDIYRFHSIYWVIMLMALDLPLPKTIFGHPWLLMDGGKMSKSSGQVLYADELVKHYGVDPVRYFALKETPYANDGIITHELIIERTNSDLVNTLGNLLNRTISMTHKYFDGVVLKGSVETEFDADLIEETTKTIKEVDVLMKEYQISKSLESILNLLKRANRYVDETSPWLLAKDETNSEKLKTVLYNLLEVIRISSILLSPFIPDTSVEIFRQLNSNKNDYESIKTFGNFEEGTKLNEPKVLFNRIDKELKLEEVNK